MPDFSPSSPLTEFCLLLMRKAADPCQDWKVVVFQASRSSLTLQDSLSRDLQLRACSSCKVDLMAAWFSWWTQSSGKQKFSPPPPPNVHFLLYNLQAKPGELAVGSLRHESSFSPGWPAVSIEYVSFYPTCVSQYVIPEWWAAKPESGGNAFHRHFPSFSFKPSSS